MFDLTTPWWEIILRTAVVYVVVLVLLRAAGKRELGQMSPVDLVVILVIANAVQNAMTGGDNSLIGGTTDLKEQNDMAASSQSGEIWNVDSEKRYGNTSTASYRGTLCSRSPSDIWGSSLSRPGPTPGGRSPSPMPWP